MREKDDVKAAFTIQVIQGDATRRPEAEVAQQWYKEIGVEMELVENTVDDILAGLVEGRHDAALFNWVYGGGDGEPDARDTLRSDGANNFSRFKNDEMDELLTQGVLELDEAKRIEIYNRVQEIVAENVPFLYFLHLQGYSFWANSIKGLPEDVLSSGAAAAIAEALVQSHHGTLALLPALPPQWPSGAVRGLRARDGVVVDLEWHDGRLVRARLQATARTTTMRVTDPAGVIGTYELAPGATVTIDGSAVTDPGERRTSW